MSGHLQNVQVYGVVFKKQPNPLQSQGANYMREKWSFGFKSFIYILYNITKIFCSQSFKKKNKKGNNLAIAHLSEWHRWTYI